MAGATEPDVYVQIPAYRDRELSATLLDLHARADRPERLRVRVLWQRGPDEHLDPRVHDLPGLEIEEHDHRCSRGCNWARARLQKAWRGEAYTLLIDSHHRFIDGWDTAAFAMYEQVRAAGSARPLLTAYLPEYDPDHDPGGRAHTPYKMYPLSRQEGVLTRLTSFPIPLWETLDAPVRADFLSLHFVLTDGEFNARVHFDPEIYFFGDEILTGLQAFTWGYDLFHPHRVLGWHAYDRGSRRPHWDDHPEWTEQQARSLARLKALLLDVDPRPDLYGRVRTVADYEDHIVDDLVLR